MAIRETSSEAVALMIRSILDLPEVDRIEFVAGKRGPFLRVHLQAAQPVRSGHLIKGGPALSVRIVAGCLGMPPSSRCPVHIVKHHQSASFA